MEEQKLRKVLIGTPTYDGKIIVQFADSLLQSVIMGYPKGYHLAPVYMANDSLVQRARNDLFKLAVENDVDDLLFIDADLQWNPNDLFRLLEQDVDFVSGIYPKKSMTEEVYPIKILDSGDITIQSNGLMEVSAVPTGFLKLSRKAYTTLWNNSEEYIEKGSGEIRKCRMVCNVTIENGYLLSEDISMCHKWRDLGEKVFLDTEINLAHFGTYRWSTNFRNYLDRIIEANKKQQTTPQVASWAAKGDKMMV